MGGADALLLDAKPPKDATRPGGNALAFDWGIMRGWAAPGPWLLAGGLTAGNVAEAMRVTGAPAVDVSSGVESAPGVKDPDADPRVRGGGQANQRAARPRLSEAA